MDMKASMEESGFIRNVVEEWLLDQMRPELCLEAKISKLRLSYSGHIMKRLTGKDNSARKG